MLSFSDTDDCLLQPQLDFILIELFHALENEIAIVQSYMESNHYHKINWT